MTLFLDLVLWIACLMLFGFLYGLISRYYINFPDPDRDSRNLKGFVLCLVVLAICIVVRFKYF